MRLTTAAHIVLTVLVLSVAHGSARTVTLTVTAQLGETVTNTLDIAEYETVEKVSEYGYSNGLLFQKDNGPWMNFGSGTGRHIVAGPAKLQFILGPSGAYALSGAVTLLITPEAFPPDRTITVAPGLGGAAITLECSTDLVNWTATTNGVFTGLPAAKFFRIKAERIP